jgi:hypothetical protein
MWAGPLGGGLGLVALTLPPTPAFPKHYQPVALNLVAFGSERHLTLGSERHLTLALDLRTRLTIVLTLPGIPDPILLDENDPYI